MSTRSKTRLASKRSKKRAIAKVSKPKKLKIEADYSEIEIESTFEPLQVDEDFVLERKTGIEKTAWYCRFADCNRGDGGRPFTNRKNRNDHEAWYFDFLNKYFASVIVTYRRATSCLAGHEMRGQFLHSRAFEIPKQKGVHKKIRNHICSECGHAFRSSTQLRQHMFVHTRVSKHKCNFCGKMFNSNCRLVEHEVNLS